MNGIERHEKFVWVANPGEEYFSVSVTDFTERVTDVIDIIHLQKLGEIDAANEKRGNLHRFVTASPSAVSFIANTALLVDHRLNEEGEVAISIQ